MIHMMREFTALVLFFMMILICLGYVRILIAPTPKTPLIVNFCLSIVLFGALLGARAVYGAMFGNMNDWTGIMYNIAGSVAALMGLKAQLLMVPRGERHRWNRFTAWMYPPEGLLGRVAFCVNHLARVWKGRR